MSHRRVELAVRPSDEKELNRYLHSGGQAWDQRWTYPDAAGFILADSGRRYTNRFSQLLLGPACQLSGLSQTGWVKCASY